MIEPFSMFINRLMDDHREGINQNTWAVYLVLSRFCDTEGKTKVSISAIVNISRLSRPTVVKHLDVLEHYGYIKREKSAERSANSYEFDNHPKVALSKKKREQEEKKKATEENENILVVPIFENWDGGLNR